MTSFAGCGSGDVRAGLALGGLAIMAGRATGGDTGVIHLGAEDAGSGLMARLASGGGGDVRIRFALGSLPIMTRRAASGDTGVVHLRAEE